jgi:hypothetical protein
VTRLSWIRFLDVVSSKGRKGEGLATILYFAFKLFHLVEAVT